MGEFLEVLVNLSPSTLNPTSTTPTNSNTTPSTTTNNNNTSPLKVAVRNKHLHFAQLLVWVG